MEKKADTPERLRKRRYEESKAAQRKEKHKVWGTSILQQEAEEIDLFLAKNGFTKRELILMGYEALQHKVKNDQTTK